MKSTARKKQSQEETRGESQTGEDKRWRKSEAEKMQVREKVGKSRNTNVFPMFSGSGGSKSRLTKAAGTETSWPDEKIKSCTPLWHKARFEVKSGKTRHSRTTVGSWDIEKVHAVVARSTFGTKKCQNTPCSDYFFTIRWPFDVQKVHAVVARSTLPSQKCQKLMVLSHFWMIRWRFRWHFWLENVLRATTAYTFLTSNHHRIIKKWCQHQVFWHFILPNVLRVTTACTFSTSQLQKVAREHAVILTFLLKMCFVPQQPALFEHRNFQKSSEAEVCCTFWL